MLHSHHRLLSFSPPPPISVHRHRSSPNPPPLLHRLRPVFLLRAQPSLAEPLDPIPPPQPSDEPPVDEGPIEILSSKPPVFAKDDNPSPLQVTTSVLLTGAISVFLFRALRRRAKRAKELRLRSTGVEKTKNLKDEALEKLRAIGATPVEPDVPPSPVQALLGGIAAGVIAVILYKFTTTIEASLNRQAISDNFSVRQMTITIRTIVNGLCYLATFVFGVNSVGLILYAIQLSFSSLTENLNSPKSAEDDRQVNNAMLSTENSVDNIESLSEDVQGSSKDPTK
ncbi:Ammonium/urea transporter domain-containing protein [Dioscorea alata]|uniref:Ammonium/urea transporter domain-containing protein n=1 Tax=Dioscorea alata TaxID=55571 RepID=A0ACB7W3T0_DIOAL|nr:Ammonium/urea transporter domain-containing protein [Dioscorea alata]